MAGKSKAKVRPAPKEPASSQVSNVRASSRPPPLFSELISFRFSQQGSSGSEDALDCLPIHLMMLELISDFRLGCDRVVSFETFLAEVKGRVSPPLLPPSLHPSLLTMKLTEIFSLMNFSQRVQKTEETSQGCSGFDAKGEGFPRELDLLLLHISFFLFELIATRFSDGRKPNTSLFDPAD